MWNQTSEKTCQAMMKQTNLENSRNRKRQIKMTSLESFFILIHWTKNPKLHVEQRQTKVYMIWWRVCSGGSMFYGWGWMFCGWVKRKDVASFFRVVVKKKKKKNLLDKKAEENTIPFSFLFVFSIVELSWGSPHKWDAWDASNAPQLSKLNNLFFKISNSNPTIPHVITLLDQVI